MPGVRRRDRRAEQQTGTHTCIESDSDVFEYISTCCFSITLAIRFWPMPQCKAIEASFVCRKKHCTNTSMLVRHSFAFGWIIPAMPKNPKFSLPLVLYFLPPTLPILSKARVATPLICARADWRRAYRHSRWVFGPLWPHLGLHDSVARANSRTPEQVGTAPRWADDVHRTRDVRGCATH